LNDHQSVHNLEIYNCNPTIAGGRFYNRLPAHIKLIKDNLFYRRQLKQLLVKGCYYSVEEYMCVCVYDDSASILCITFKFHYLSIRGILIFATNAVLELKL
jgi:hypothetical protein